MWRRKRWRGQPHSGTSSSTCAYAGACAKPNSGAGSSTYTGSSTYAGACAKPNSNSGACACSNACPRPSTHTCADANPRADTYTHAATTTAISAE